MKNWKTTLVGALSAVASVVVPLIQSGSVNVVNLILAGSLALLGYFAKDAE